MTIYHDQSPQKEYCQPGGEGRGVGIGEPAFVCVEVLRPSQANGVMSSAVSLPNHTCTGQA